MQEKSNVNWDLFHDQFELEKELGKKPKQKMYTGHS